MTAVVPVAGAMLGTRPARLGPVRLVCVDGPAGSGKTTLAGDLGGWCAAAGRSVHVVHLDDLYAGWTGLEGDLWPRLTAQVLEPLRRGRPGRFQRYDWGSRRFAEWVDVPVTEVLVLEGCGSARRAADHDATLRIWVEADSEERLARGMARDGEGMRHHWKDWMVAEQRHFAAEGTRERSDLRADGYGQVAP
ncbi:uridine kinase family protein [Cellulomonas hominis]